MMPWPRGLEHWILRILTLFRISGFVLRIFGFVPSSAVLKSLGRNLSRDDARKNAYEAR
jgi:hypothetical protein